MNAANMANAYKRQQIMTASPAELTLMLYNGAIRFVTESIRAIEKRISKRPIMPTCGPRRLFVN